MWTFDTTDVDCGRAVRLVKRRKTALYAAAPSARCGSAIRDMIVMAGLARARRARPQTAQRRQRILKMHV